MRRITCILLVCCLLPLVAAAQLRLPSVIGDGMVLQRNSSVRLWGKAAPSSQVRIAAGWAAEPVEASASHDGDWSAEIPTTEAGGPYTIEITSGTEQHTLQNVLLGEVWICAGQSNMSMPVRGFESQPIAGSLEAIVSSPCYPIRMYTADRTVSEHKEFNVKGRWMEAGVATTGAFSAVGFFFARTLCQALNVPVGMINLSWGGSTAQAWSSRELLMQFPEIDITMNMQSKSPQRIPSALHNAMFHPVAGYGVRGVIWYQGENNLREPELYARLFPAMVREWRTKIGRGDIPFYYVQIAPFDYGNAAGTEAAKLREAQARCRYTISNSGMVVTIDLGEEKQIHYASKSEVGFRLGCQALAGTYGFGKLPHNGPVYRRWEKEGGRMILTFDHAEGGLCLKPSQTTGFEIAGTDGRFIPARAEVHPRNKKQVVIWSDEVTDPADVRYCFRNFAVGTLYDAYGLPAAPFRTDNYPR